MKVYGVSVLAYGYAAIEANSEEEAITKALEMRKTEFEYPDSWPSEDELEIVEESEYEESAGPQLVVELCNECNTEAEFMWDVKRDGYKAFCPNCGARLMLCDMCQHRNHEDEHMGDCDYNSETDSCRFNHATRKDEKS